MISCDLSAVTDPCCVAVLQSLSAVLMPSCCQQCVTDYELTLIMAAVHSRCGHYIFALWFLLSSSSFFFPRLISAIADWMSTILLHMVWP